MTVENVSKIVEEKEDEIQVQHYAPLQVLANDSYVFYESENGVMQRFRGKIYGHKVVHEAGATELILMQEQNLDGSFGKWRPFLYRNKDPTVSIISMFDLVPRASVDIKANDRITKLGFLVSWTFIFILLYILIANVQIDMTITFFLMLFGFALAITSTFYYELKRRDEDFVYTATIFQSAPKIPISRSFVHPITGEVMRFFGEVPIIEVKSSKVTFYEIRGFGVHEMHEALEYAKDMDVLRTKVTQYELLKLQFANLTEESQVSEAEIKELEKLILEQEKSLHELKNQILLKYHNYVLSSHLSEELDRVKKEMQEKVLKEKIDFELFSQEADVEALHTRISQLEIERDKYEKEAQSWMKAANRDVNQFNIVVAAKLSKILKQGALVDVYEPSSLTDAKRFNNLNGYIISSLAGFIPFIVLFVIFMIVYNTIKNALSQMGSWASFVYVLTVTILAIGIGFFIFAYAKSRIVDVAKNQSSSKKVVS